MGLIITAVIVGTLVSQVPIAWCADRYGQKRVLFICSICLAAAFVVMGLLNRWEPFVPTGAMVGAFAGSLYPIALSMVGGMVPRARLGAATSLFSLAFGTGSLIGPAASGFAMTITGNPRWLFYLPALLTALFVFELVVICLVATPRRVMEASD